jgi:hypothetical protein
MPAWVLPEMSPWRRRQLTIPPDSLRAWVRFAVWEFWMGILVCGALGLGVTLILAAPSSIAIVPDLTNCYAPAPVVQPCEQVAYRTGELSAAFSVLCGLQLMAVAAWFLWELWSAVEPKPITDDFLKLLNDSFGRDWRNPRTWPWARMLWAFGFTLPGVTSALVIWTLVSSSLPVKAPIVHIETSQSFRLAP